MLGLFISWLLNSQPYMVPARGQQEVTIQPTGVVSPPKRVAIKSAQGQLKTLIGDSM
jgi:hypothetical protein